ncbi:MAG: VanZ family protein [Anaerolineales bacterium]|nr:VanZ family protein [Anaerolineales bacterium]
MKDITLFREAWSVKRGGRISAMDNRQVPMIIRWLPALLLMTAIFLFSSTPASRLPHFGTIDLWIKKGGHATGYALLAFAYYFALPPRLSPIYRAALAFIMALLFALSDEFHQSFVEGRTSSLRDVGIDSAGAALALLVRPAWAIARR